MSYWIQLERNLRVLSSANLPAVPILIPQRRVSVKLHDCYGLKWEILYLHAQT